MKVRHALPFLLLLPIFGFIAWQVANDRLERERERLAEAAARAPLADDTAPAPAAPAPMVDAAPAPVDTVVSNGGGRDVNQILRQIAQAGQPNYLNEIIPQRDSALTRWPDRVDNPLRIWVADGSALPGWNPNYPARVREAFDTWALTGVPVRFTFVRDSVDGDVAVQWVDRFDAPITGRTDRIVDRNWWIVNGHITIALHHATGEPLDEPSIHAIALHEVGHLLGLEHCADTANIMTPKVRVRDLTDQDRNTMRLLYSLPPGSLRH